MFSVPGFSTRSYCLQNASTHELIEFAVSAFNYAWGQLCGDSAVDEVGGCEYQRIFKAWVEASFPVLVLDFIAKQVIEDVIR